MLEVVGLSAKYGQQEVLREISFSLQSGEILCIIGANGSGKSTLLHSLMGLLKSSGEIHLQGQGIEKLSWKQRAKAMALLSQHSGVDFPYTVWDTVSFARYAHGKHPFSALSSGEKEMISQQLQALGLWEKRDTLISQLSGGQLQRVYLARTFVQNPHVILLDEPTNHLDLKVQLDLLSQLETWVSVEDSGGTGRGVIGVFHDLNLVRQFAHKLLLLYEGNSLAFGTVEEVLPQLHKAYDMDVVGHMRDSYGRWMK